MCSMSTPNPASQHYAEDGHPLNVQRGSRFHVEAEGITVCGQCAVEHAMTAHNGWNTRQSLAILRLHGYEADPYVTGDERDWCVVCDADFDRNATYPRR